MDIDRNSLRIGVYVGEGASHSWTWFVDLLEKYAYSRVRLIQESDFSRHAPEQDVLLVSGGDTFAMARALKAPGAAALQAFLDRGGLYIGSCAGAYLPLNSSKDGLCDFNFVKTKINNLTRDLPAARQLPLKFSTQYGCAYIYHPVREEVRVRMDEAFPVWGGREIRVPLYGGPPMELSEDSSSLALYSGFTSRTQFLTDEQMAEKVYLGKVAACEKKIGPGRMVLLGPHFEHPWFPEGNAVIEQWIRWHLCPGAAAPAEGPASRKSCKSMLPSLFSPSALRALKVEISNMRIRAGALARKPVHWQIGAKVYEPEKIEYFIDAVWKRLRRLEPATAAAAGPEAAAGLPDKAVQCHGQLKDLAVRVSEEADSQAAAEEMFRSLRALVADFLEVYFGGISPEPQGSD